MKSYAPAAVLIELRCFKDNNSLQTRNTFLLSGSCLATMFESVVMTIAGRYHIFLVCEFLDNLEELILRNLIHS